MLITGRVVAIAMLTTMAAPLSAEERVVRMLSYNDDWYYRGESLGGYEIPATLSGPFCEGSFCADGSGSLGTDYSWWYDGNFVAGLFEGAGELTNDFFTYVGEFKRGEFHGHGILKCLDGAYFEGSFINGKMIGEFKRAPGENAPSQQFSGMKVGAGSYAPCKDD